jgi:hypothetical protein
VNDYKISLIKEKSDYMKGKKGVIWRSGKKSPALVQRDVVLHFAIIQRTISTPHDYKICTPFYPAAF